MGLRARQRRDCCANGSERAAGGATIYLVNQVPAGNLSGLSWLLPGVADAGDGIDWFCSPYVFSSATMGGAPGVLYDVTLNFVGVVEGKTYVGGTNDGASFQIGGAPAVDTANTYRLSIGDPVSTYYINRGVSHDPPIAINYNATIQIRTGALVVLSADDGGDGKEHKHTISVPGVTSPAQPYVGQFCNMSVVSVVPH